MKPEVSVLSSIPQYECIACPNPMWSAVQEYENLEAAASAKTESARALLELVQRYGRRLTSELDKFTIELEADHPGITETLAKRVPLPRLCLRRAIALRLRPLLRFARSVELL